MDPLASASSAAASAVTLALANQAASTSAAGQSPGAGTVAAQGQSGVQASFAMAALKTSLGVEASVGSQLAQLMGLGGGVDITA